MKTSSAKAKARRLQNRITELIYKYYPELEEGDVRPAIMGESGMDIKLSPRAKKIFPYAVESKNQEKVSIWEACKQAIANAEDLEPIVVFARNRTSPRVVIDLESFLKLTSDAAHKA